MSKTKDVTFSMTRRPVSSIRTKEELFALYPQLSKRKEPILSVYDAVREPVLTLVETDNTIGGNVSLQWIKIQLIELLSYLGAFNQATEYQITTLARHIRKKFFYLTFAELTYFFEAFADGGYGTMYVGKSINPQNIMEALAKYEDDVLMERGRVEDERKNLELSEQLKVEREKKEKGITGYTAWLRYCKATGRADTRLPGFKCKNISR